MSRPTRLTLVSWATVSVSTVVLLGVASTARAIPALPDGTATMISTASVRAPSDTGASDVTNLGSGGWAVQSSAIATQTGAQISTPGFDASTWLPVTNDDAGAPGTEIEALAQNGRCPGDTALQPVNQGTGGASSVFFSANMKSCYGFMSATGADTVKDFSVPWWWRTDFTPNLQAGQVATLIVNGVVGSANVWVNGQELATSATVTGAYTRFSFSLTKLVKTGTNSLAIEVSPNNPNTMFTLDDVDWNQIPPDNNTGIQFPVQLAVDGALSDGNAHVVENNTADWQNSTLISGDIAEQISRLKQEPGRNIGMSGSSTLVSWLLRHGLLDQLDLLVFPVVVGSGKRLFSEPDGQVALTLTGSESFGTGVVHLSYEPAERR